MKNATIFETFFLHAEPAILLINEEGLILNANLAATDLFGYPAMEMEGAKLGLFLSLPFSELKTRYAVPHREAGHGRLNSPAGPILAYCKDASSLPIHLHDVTVFDGFTALTLTTGDGKKTCDTYSRLFFEEANDAIYMTDSAARPAFLDVNKNGCAMLGYTRKELLGMTTFDIIFEEDLAENPSRLEEVLEGKGVRNERRLKRKDGTAVYAELSVKQLSDGKVMTIARDITARKNAELKLVSSEKRFRALVENNYDIISLVDASFKPIYRSPSLMRVLGYDEQDMQAADAGDKIHPDDKDGLSAAFGEARRRPGTPINMSFRRQHKDGRFIWLEGIVTNLLDDPHVNGYVTNLKDVSDRKVVEAQLQKRELLFKTMVENNYDIISLLDENFRPFYRSPSASRIMGWTDEEMLKMDSMENIHPEDRPHTEQWIRQAMQNPGKAIPATLRRKHKNGHYLWLEGSITNLLEEEEIRALVTNFRDITERKKAEELLRHNELRFRTLIENNNDIISLMDAKFRIIYRSPSAQRIMGWTNEELLYKEATALVHPEELEKAKETVREMLASPGKPIHTLFRNKHKNGHYVWLEGTVINLLHEEYVQAIVYNYRDVTERKKAEDELALLNKNLEQIVVERTSDLERTLAELKESEEKFSKIFTSSAAGITITELPDLRYVDVNPAFEKMTEFSKTELVGKTPQELGISTDARRRSEVIHQLATTGSIQSIEIELRTKSGKIISLLAAVETISLRGKMYSIGIVYDITARKQTEAELLAVNKELEAFSYSVSHDLRAPLRAIHGYSEVLSEDYRSTLGSEGERTLDLIKNNASRMGQLIDDLLALSRLGRKAIRTSPVDLNKLVNDVIRDIERTAPHRARITVGTLATVEGDYSLLKQVLINLISNAVKYSSQKEQPVIEITSEETEFETLVSIKDNGAGFDMRYVNKLFGVFQRLHSDEQFTGTGVGLAIAQRIVTKHGGRIWATGEVNAGAVFHFSIPKPITHEHTS